MRGEGTGSGHGGRQVSGLDRSGDLAGFNLFYSVPFGGMLFWMWT